MFCQGTKTREMARATRSTDPAIKKRKRNSSPVEKPLKFKKTDDSKDGSLPSSDAHAILQVLETSDPLGLLDRVFPSSGHSLSLRTLLSNSQQYSLRLLKAAVHQLYPLSSHRSKHSDTAHQQLHFCSLAISLLDQASSTSTPLSIHSPSILTDDSINHSPPPLARRYALVQHLPSGDYWSSLNSDRPSSPSPQLKDISTGHAELVAVLPTPSSQSSHPVATIGSFNAAKSYPKKPLPTQRRVTTSAFLDYGPWASFAPTYDHDCELVGRRELGEAIWFKSEKKALRTSELREWIEGKGSITEIVDQDDKMEQEPIDVAAEFDGLLPPEDIQNLKAALDNVELERLVDELLRRNQVALLRLQDLQLDRLTSDLPESTTVDETSEEWEIANGIFQSLETLASLRPRAANGQVISIMPPPSVLHKLHKTLATEPRPGWQGTLAASRTTALRDDSTVKVRPSSTVPAVVSTSSSPAPTTVAPITSTATPTTPYAGYTYAYPAQQQQAQAAYRPATATTTAAATYTPYKPGATSYYQNYIQTAQQQQQYYGQQAYGVGATGQQPYAAYSSWFAHAQYSQATAAASTPTATGRGTPQPATYNAYAAQSAYPAQQRPATTPTVTTPAVANTVAMNKVGTGAATGAWPGYTAQPGAIPAHMRTTQQNGYQPQQQSYGAYQAAR